VSNILFQAESISNFENEKIKKEASNRNIYYAIHSINLYAHHLWSIEKEKLKVGFISVIYSDIGNVIVNSYLEEFRKLLYPTLAHEFNILINEGFIEENFSFFIENTTNDIEWIEYFFDKYPVLIENLEKTISYAISFAVEFLLRLDNDIIEIQDKFSVQLEEFISINVFSGDNHNNLRSVAELNFGSKSIYYKPRTLNTEELVYKLFGFLQLQGLKESIFMPSVLSKKEYGWMEGVDFKEVVSDFELKEFYFNQGVNLAVFHVIEATDLISDNIIAHGKLPCYFDLECVLQPNVTKSQEPNIYEVNSFAASFLQSSILRTGLIPQHGFITDEYQGLSNSGLSFITGFIPEMTTKEIDGKFTRKYEKLDFNSNNKHIPSYNGVKYESREFISEIVSGFNYAYDLIKEKRNEISDFILLNFKNVKTRVLYRSTYIYSKLISESFLPTYLNSIEEKQMLFNELKNAKFKSINNSSIIDSEIDQLHNLDIPIFHTLTDSIDIISVNNEIVSKYFSEISGINSVLNKIKNLSEADKLRQIELIELSFCIHEGYEIDIESFLGSNHNFEKFNSENPDISADKILFEISKIYSKIQENSFKDEDGYSYLGVIQTPRYTWDISSQGWDLFDGLDGLSFFFLNLFKINKNNDALEVGKYFVEKGLEQFEMHEEYYDKMTSFNKISLFNYPISTFYVAEYYLSDGIELCQLSKKLIDRILNWIEKHYINDFDFDLLGGGAGTIIYLLKLYDRLKEERIIILCKQIAHRLVDMGHNFDLDQLCWVSKHDKAHTGLSHGSSGVAFSLFKLDSYLEEPVFKEFAIKALNYERELFDKDKKFWYFFRFIEKKEIDFTENHFWAYGSGSMLASRLLISDYYQDQILYEEIEIAKENILSKGSMSNFNYSSGVFGNVDVLNDYSIFKNDTYMKEQLLNNVNNLVASKKENECWACARVGKNYSSSLEMIGLFTGISGIGNTMLNVIEPNSVNRIFK
jgi:type 2 lantibiotic biosynthesis protein LanM